MKIGIIGAGHIAQVVSRTLKVYSNDEDTCWAVASRDIERARSMAAELGFRRAYGGYEELVRDPEVELVYIATPHSLHFEHMKLCIENGKNVLCEKAFTVNAGEARKIKELARERGVYVAEAIWPRYMPSRRAIDGLIASGLIGTPNILTANLSYPISHRARITDPELAGGALLDVGVYGLNFALMHFGGDIERIDSSVKMTDTGVDGMESITLHYSDGRMAVLTHGIWSRSDRKGIIYGDRGYIVVENINNPRSATVYGLDDRPVRTLDFAGEQISGYEYEFLEAEDCIRRGALESTSMPLEDSIGMMELMDEIRGKWGFKYPKELRT